MSIQGILIVFAAVLGYMAICLTNLERLKQGGSMKDVDPESRSVFEKLTGFKYENCWGHNSVGYKKKLS